MAPARWPLRVIVTRPREQASALAERLAALGLEVVLCPLLELEATGPDEVDVSGYDWVVVTSPRGAQELAARRRGELPTVAAIGPGTAAALREHGIEPALVPQVSTQEGLVAELPQPPGRVLFAGAADARPYLAEALDADTVVLYRTREVRPSELPEGDLVVLASASAARAFAGLGLDLPAVSIGPETTREARARGIDVVAEAGRHDLDGLVEATAGAARVSGKRIS
jgi:uroporphyrinogen III methyltransferase / synthase